MDMGVIEAEEYCGSEWHIEFEEFEDECLPCCKDGVVCTYDMFFGDECESACEYAEWFWDFYGSDVYDDLDVVFDNCFEYKVYEYIF